MATVKKHPARDKGPRAPFRRGLLFGLPFAALVAGSAWLIWHGLRSHYAEDTPVIEPPVIELAGVDPAVIRAIEVARAAVKQSPRSAQAWGQLGKTLLAHDFHVPAGTCLAQAERLNPAEARWPYLHGIALASADPPDPGAALQDFQRAVDRDGEASRVLRLRLGEALLEQDRLEEAEQQFQRILHLDPANGRAHLGLARLAIRRGDPEKSRSHLERTLADPHAKKASRLLLAEVQQRLGKEVSAEELRQAAQLPEDPAWPDPFWEDVARLTTGLKTHLSRAGMQLRQGRFREAVFLLKQTVRDYPDAYAAWLMLGKALIKEKNLKEAEQALNTALKLGPDSAEVQFHLGVALFRQGKQRAAETLFRSATEAKPNFAMAHYNLGHCLLRRGDRAGAIEAFRVTLRCQPDYAEAHTMLGDLLAKNGQPAEAFAHARLALHYNPADATAKKLVQQLLPRIAIPITP
jgi:tetratricopeptide (TPR) repeat protein